MTCRSLTGRSCPARGAFLLGEGFELQVVLAAGPLQPRAIQVQAVPPHPLSHELQQLLPRHPRGGLENGLGNDGAVHLAEAVAAVDGFREPVLQGLFGDRNPQAPPPTSAQLLW